MLLAKRIPLSYIFKKVKSDLVYVFIVGLVVNVFKYTFDNFLPEMPLNIPVFLGTAISILLSFKISQSYDRWWEARKIWGSIVNDSRSFVLQLQGFLLLDNPTLIKKMAYRQIAWCYSLGQSLRGLNPVDNIENLLSTEDLNDISRHANKPLAILQLNVLDLKKLRADKQISDFPHIQIDETYVRLCDSMGRAERINNTVFPASYRIFLHFTIYLFVAVLSIALKDIYLIYELPLLILFSMVFFLLEKTAYHMQDPFMNRPSDTSVTAIARTIDINIRQLLGEEKVPEPLKAESYYIL